PDEGEAARFGEGEGGRDGEGDRDEGGGDGGAADPFAAFPEPGRDRAREERPGDRAGQRAGRGGKDRQPSPPRLQLAQRRQPEGDPEGEGQLPVGEQGDDAGGKPERRPARLRPPVLLDDAVEEVGGGDD